MDDFGGGYTGLAALAQFPFDKIKIDRDFVSQLTEDRRGRGDRLRHRRARPHAERRRHRRGCGDSEQVTLLKAAGCSIVQGFLFGVPKRKADGDAEAGVRRSVEGRLPPQAPDPIAFSAPAFSGRGHAAIAFEAAWSGAGGASVTKGGGELRGREKPLMKVVTLVLVAVGVLAAVYGLGEYAIGRMMRDDALAPRSCGRGRSTATGDLETTLEGTSPEALESTLSIAASTACCSSRERRSDRSCTARGGAELARGRRKARRADEPLYAMKSGSYTLD